MADLETLNARLAEAEAARHKLLTGTRVVKVGEGPSSIEYNAAFAGDLDRLNSYIASLKQEIAVAGGAAALARIATVQNG